MSLVTVIWSMVTSACLTVGAVHFLVWCRRHAARDSLLFALMAAATAWVMVLELRSFGAQTSAEYGVLIRWGHVPFWVVVVSLVGLVRIHLRVGRPWLAWTVMVMRTLALILNFVFSPNINFREITALRAMPFLGETVSSVVGVPNPWMLIGQASILLLVVFLVDATIGVWRRGDRGAMLWLGGTMVLFVAASMMEFILCFWGIVSIPMTPSLFFLGIVATMGFQLSDGVIRTATLADDLHESEARYRDIFDGTIEGIFRTTLQGKLMVANPALAKMLRYASPEEVVSGIEDTMLQVWATPDERSRYLRLLEELGTVRGYECQFKRKDGTLIWVSLTSRVHRGPDGQPDFIEGFIEDVTEHKRFELETLRNRAEIAHLSRVAMLGELSGSLAHELNQPLTAILSNAQAAQRFLAEDQPDLAEVRDILQDIVSDDQRAGEVIRRLRRLLKKGEVTHLPLDLNEVVQDVLKLVRNDLLNHNIQLRMEFAADLPEVTGDRVQLQQVLLNLIVNAVDALAQVLPDVKQLVVRTERDREAGVRVLVTDSGAGLAPEVADHVFDPFFTTKPTGMGMGLKVCRTIIEAHGGQLGGANNPGKGATFHFTLPIAKDGGA